MKGVKPPSPFLLHPGSVRGRKSGCVDELLLWRVDWEGHGLSRADRSLWRRGFSRWGVP